MKKVTLIFSAVLITALALTSCSKKGCTDPLASNYDASAEKDDGSCMLLEPETDPDPDPISVHLNPNLSYGSVTDIDGNAYATIQIGAQTWMAENLRTTKYCNGDAIPIVTDNTDWESITNDAWFHYNNDSQYEIPYGKLYNWYAVDDARNICPCGWHVPTDAEWTVLTDYLGGESLAGGKMKSNGTQYWQSPNTDATNESGLSALPGGVRFFDGPFYFVGSNGYWCSSTEYNADSAWGRELNYSSGNVIRFEYIKATGFSVRCIMD